MFRWRLRRGIDQVFVAGAGEDQLALMLEGFKLGGGVDISLLFVIGQTWRSAIGQTWRGAGRGALPFAGFFLESIDFG